MSVIDPQNLARALGGEASGNKVLAPSPGHSAKDRSLSITVGPELPGGFVINSFSGHDWQQCKDYVRQKAGLEPFKPNGQRRYNGAHQPKRKIVATFDYTDERGALLYQVVKYDPKDFRQRRSDGNGGWIPKLGDVRRVPYRLPEILQYPDATVFVCEGEKDADRVASLQYCATTVASGKWTDDCVKPIAGRDVIILQNNDDAGVKKALAAAQALHGVAKTIRVLLLPDTKSGGDVSDWLDADPQRDGEMLARICMDAPVWTPASSEIPNEATTTLQSARASSFEMKKIQWLWPDAACRI